jgi:hypothetical protein
MPIKCKRSKQRLRSYRKRIGLRGTKQRRTKQRRTKQRRTKQRRTKQRKNKRSIGGNPSSDEGGGFEVIDESDMVGALCNVGCGRTVAPGVTINGNPYNTCCRRCVVEGGHDPMCDEREEEERAAKQVERSDRIQNRATLVAEYDTKLKHLVDTCVGHSYDDNFIRMLALEGLKSSCSPTKKEHILLKLDLRSTLKTIREEEDKIRKDMDRGVSNLVACADDPWKEQDELLRMIGIEGGQANWTPENILKIQDIIAPPASCPGFIGGQNARTAAMEASIAEATAEREGAASSPRWSPWSSAVQPPSDDCMRDFIIKRIMLKRHPHIFDIRDKLLRDIKTTEDDIAYLQSARECLRVPKKVYNSPGKKKLALGKKYTEPASEADEPEPEFEPASEAGEPESELEPEPEQELEPEPEPQADTMGKGMRWVNKARGTLKRTPGKKSTKEKKGKKKKKK